MSDILELLKSKFFLIATIVMIICGVIMTGYAGIDYLFGVLGFVTIIMGILLLISGFLTPIVSQSKTGMGLGVILIIVSIVSLVGVFSLFFVFDEIAMPILIGGIVLSVLAFLAWPCICVQGSKDIRAQIIGIASAHDKITITELSNTTGASVKLTSEIVYDAIGKRELSGRMEGATFVRSAPSTTSYSAPTTTREREIVKVLVICPYCGAKTEQGISKCSNCQADL